MWIGGPHRGEPKSAGAIAPPCHTLATAHMKSNMELEVALHTSEKSNFPLIKSLTQVSEGPVTMRPLREKATMTGWQQSWRRSLLPGTYWHGAVTEVASGKLGRSTIENLLVVFEVGKLVIHSIFAYLFIIEMSQMK